VFKTISQKIRNSLRFKKNQTVAETRPLIENAPTAELTTVERIALPSIAARMVRIESNPGHPNYRRRALFYENDFYSRF